MKPFLRYDKQYELLNNKGIRCIDEFEKEILRKYGYYNLINGYKEPFLIDGTKEHIYLPSTSIRDFREIKIFDDKLRSMLFEKITCVEDRIRTLIGYYFDKFNFTDSHIESWKNTNSYDIKADELELQKFIQGINNDIDKAIKFDNDYVKHYSQKHGITPMWIVVKVISFKKVIKLLELSKKKLRIAICDVFNIEYDELNNNFRVMFGALHWFRIIRNATAHNERIFKLKSRENRVISVHHKSLSSSYSRATDKKTIMDCIILLKYFIDHEIYHSFTSKIKDRLEKLNNNIAFHSYHKVRSSLGIKKLDDLFILTNLKKKINY